MKSARSNLSATLCALGIWGVALSACQSDGGGGTGGAPGTGGSPATGGATATGGAQATGGKATGGTPATGGAPATGGSMPGTGGAATGGATTTGGQSAGGRGGSPGTGGITGGGGSPSTGGSSGACVKGQTKGSEVVVIGESFIAFSHGITKGIENLAKAAGSLAQSDKYIDNSVSGTTLAGDIPKQYDRAATSVGKIKYVIMDGGGNDCMGGGTGDAAITAATALFKNMASKGTEKVQYFFYPDPIGSNWSSLKGCLDVLRPKMKALCEGLTAPKCYWLDLRPTWNGHNEYTSDGIHPTAAGDKATAEAIWPEMVKNCVAQ